MAVTFDSRRLRILAAVDKRFKADMRTSGRNIAQLIQRAATARTDGGEAIVPNTMTARIELKTAIWASVLKPYFIGATADPMRGPEPLSPFAALLTGGIYEELRNEAQRQITLLRQVVKDRIVFDYLTGPRPVGPAQPITEVVAKYDPFHLFVDPNGYRLSDRIWRDSIDVRSRVDRLLDYEISQGTSAVRMATMLEQFLTPDASVSRTNKPYGREGSYAARRLARTEITAAAGRAVVDASQANPFVGGVRWRLSGSHKEIDECNANAEGGPNGDGIYAPGQTPAYPNHPHCLCSLLPVPAQDIKATVKSLRADIAKAAKGLPVSERTRILKGMFGEDFLSKGQMDGRFQDAMQGLSVTRPGQPIAGPFVIKPGVIEPVVKPPRVRKPKATEPPPPPPKPYDLSEGTRIREALADRVDALDKELADQTRQYEALNKRIQERSEAYNKLINAAPTAAEQERLIEEVWQKNKDERQAFWANAKRLEDERRDIFKNAFDLPEAQRSKIKLTDSSAFAGRAGVKDFRAREAEAVDFVNRVTGGVTLDIRVDLNKTGREYATRGAVSLNTSTTTQTIVHEIGHNIEYQRGAAYRAKRLAFFDDRTAGDPVTKFVDTFPGYGYKADEVYKRDKWESEYTGKIYAHDSDVHPASEIISMATEQLYKNPLGLIKKDPELFDFIVSYLRGSL